MKKRLISVITVLSLCLASVSPVYAEEVFFDAEETGEILFEEDVTWKSSNTAVAKVSSTGLVTAVAKGTATITVTTKDGSKTATCKVTVKVPVTGVTLDKTTVTIKKGKTLQLTATVKPSNASNKNVTWKSNYSSRAKVDSNGLVTAVSPGRAAITVMTADGSYTAKCVVIVE